MIRVKRPTRRILATCLALLTLLTPPPLWAQDGLTPAAADQANRLFDQAVTAYLAAPLQGEDRARALTEVVAILRRIERDHAGSVPGRWMAREPWLGPIHWPSLSAQFPDVAPAPAPAPDPVADPAPETGLDWVNRIVPGGHLAGMRADTYASDWGHTHMGEDIGGCGLLVLAAADGRVVKRMVVGDGRLEALGNAVLIEHDTPPGARATFSLYAHLADSPRVGFGSVKEGQTLGRVGRSGSHDHSEDCTLHFEIRHFNSIFHPGWTDLTGPDPVIPAELRQAWSLPAKWFAAQDAGAGGRALGRAGDAAPAVSPIPQRRPTPRVGAPVANPETDPIAARFAPACAKVAGELAPFDLPCPIHHADMCQGEGCRTTGVMQARQPITLWSAPGGGDRLATIAQGAFLAALQSDSWAAPCRAHALSPSDIGLGGRGPVFRTAYWSEGTYRYVDGAGRLGGGPMMDKDGVDPACDNRAETWTRVQTRDGRQGWIGPRRDLHLDGAGRFHGPMEDPPDWVLAVVPEAVVLDTHVAHDGNMCRDATPRLPDSHLRARAEARLRYTNNLGEGGHLWAWAQGGRTRYVRIHENDYTEEGERQAPRGGVVCFTVNGPVPTTCSQIRLCHDEGGYVPLTVPTNGPFRGVDRALSRDVDWPARVEWHLNDIENAETWQTLFHPDMVLRDGRRLLECRDRFTRHCLRGLGLSARTAGRHITLAKVLGDTPVAVENYVQIGRFAVADLVFLTRANSNYQTVVFERDRPMTAAHLPGNLIAAASHPAARAMRRTAPNATVDTGRGHLTYLRFQGEALLAYYQYPVLAGCRACDVLGNVTVEYRIHWGSLSHRAVHWSLSHGTPTSTDLLRDPRVLQQELARAGHYTGAIDGILGRGSAIALRDFQHEHCLPVTGRLDARSARALAGRRDLWAGCVDED